MTGTAAVIGTLLNHEIVSFTWIIIGLVVGGAIGAAISIWMPMTAVPQRTAISHAFGALAATLVVSLAMAPLAQGLVKNIIPLKM